jgi:hypothetical protein
MTSEITLWIAQIILAGLFGFAGILKATRPIASLTPTMAWAGDVPPALVRFVGVVELAGALGMILPILTGILPWLTPLAAIGFLIIQILAIGLYASRGETAKTVALNLVLLALSVFVVWGRWNLFGA